MFLVVTFILPWHRLAILEIQISAADADIASLASNRMTLNINVHRSTLYASDITASRTLQSKISGHKATLKTSNA